MQQVSERRGKVPSFIILFDSGSDSDFAAKLVRLSVCLVVVCVRLTGRNFKVILMKFDKRACFSSRIRAIENGSDLKTAPHIKS